jgi:hypothetical protein
MVFSQSDVTSNQWTATTMKEHCDIRQRSQKLGFAYFGTFPFLLTQSAHTRKNVKEPKFPSTSALPKNNQKDKYKHP